MKKNTQFSKLHTFIVGICIGITTILAIMVLNGNVPWLKAAGVGTGAPDINAGYLDGYGTSLSAAANKIYVSDTNGYLPQVLPTGMIAMFDTTCPTGWTRLSALDGKFLVASSTYNTVAGGSDNVTLTVNQIPAHTHTGTTDSAGAHSHTYYRLTYVGSGGTADGLYAANDRGNYNAATTDTVAAHAHTFTTDSTGGGQAFDNRPAFATVILCKKD